MHYTIRVKIALPVIKGANVWLTFSRKDIVRDRSTSRGDVSGRNPSGNQRSREHLLQLGFQSCGLGIRPPPLVFGWSTFIFGSTDAAVSSHPRRSIETLTSLRPSQVLSPSLPPLLSTSCARGFAS
jgi:hypothetical protein